ncbi:MAG: 16S rRNA (uracil(1498)-N(3))-methyltransferase [Alphaproteobacteria bacterium]
MGSKAITATPRLFTNRDLTLDAIFDLPPEASHYLARVMRLGEGDHIRLFNGRDGEFKVKINKISKLITNVKVEHCLRTQASAGAFELIFAVIKRNRLEHIIEKACELGIACLRPVQTRYSNQKLPNPTRLERILLEAAEQSERLDVPHLSKETTLQKLLENWDQDRPLFACIETGIANALPTIMESVTKHPQAGILIGPEGGFSAEEIEHLTSLSFVHPVSLGPRILKADTAALYALSLLQAKWGDGDLLPPRDLNIMTKE